MLKYFISIICVILVLSSCDKKSTNPKPEPEEHLFYVGAKTGGLVKIFSVEENMFIDSLICDSIPEDMETTLNVIGKDSVLAISCVKGTYFIDLHTKQVSGVINFAELSISPDSKYYMGQNISENNRFELRILEDNSFICEIAHSYEHFSNDSRYVSSVRYFGNDSINIVVYDILTGNTSSSQGFSQGSRVWFWLNYPIGKYQKTIFGASADPFRYFGGILDFYSDSVRILKNFSILDYYEANMPIAIVDLDDKYAYLSTMIGTAFGGIPDGKIYVYDVESEDSIGTIDIGLNVVPSAYSISYDGKYLIAKTLEESGSDLKSEFYLIDTEELTVIGVYDYGGYLSKIASRNNIKIGE
ncbi:MAG: hypothetical protein ABIJ45_13265 [Candidatus Zixiibacteriota bacterium]